MKRFFLGKRFSHRIFLGVLACLGSLAALATNNGVFAQDTAASENVAITLENRDIPRFHEQCARMNQGNVELLMVGDSITHCWEGAGKDVWEKFYGHRNAMNFGISGDRTEHVLWRLANSPLDKIQPRMAVVMIGTNNIGHGSSNAANTVEGIQKIIDVLKEKYPEMKILLLEVFPREEAPEADFRCQVNEINAGLRTLYQDAQVENVQLLSLADKYLDENGHLPASLMPDYLHPNAEGYQIWAETIEPYVVQGLGEKDNMAVTLESRNIELFQKQSEQMAKGDVDLLMVGDSITDFWSTTGNEVWNEYYGHRKALNFGISGDRTGHVLWRLEHAPVDKISPKMAVVMIGTNNVGHGSSNPAQTVQGIQRIIGKLKKLYPQMKILLLEVFPREGKPDADLRRQVNEINAGLHKYLGQVENVQLYSLDDLLLEKDGTLSKNIMPDFLHPNHKGYQIWAKAIEPMVAEGLGEKPAECVGTPRNDQWWMDRFNEKNELLKQGGCELLMIGDSITHGWEGAQDVWNKYYGDKHPINLGIGGDQTCHVIWRLENYDFSQTHPKLAVLLIGVNNVAGGSTGNNTAYGNRVIAKLLHEKFPQMPIIVLNVFPWGNKEETEKHQKVQSVNELLPYYLRDLDYVTLVNINDVFLDENGDLPAELMPDFLHPNAVGYEKWGNALDALITEKIQQQ